LPESERTAIAAATQPEQDEMKTRVYVTLKNGVLDPQGKAIHHALEGLGFHGVNDVRAGKLIELDLDASVADADVEAMCRKLLANTVIENFHIERAAEPEEAQA
jgi:phosphoribosylformylglycinamidine synthase